jgi:cell division FtsZ-interacting protein ZapD
MTDAKSEASQALKDHGNSIEALHRKLAAVPGVDQERLTVVVAKYKTAHAVFEEDAAECIGS